MQFKITISSLSQKKLSQLKDSLRILAWNEFKTNYKEEITKYKSVLEFYQDVFDPLWSKSPISSMNLDEILKYIASLEYTPESLLEMRSKHYQGKADAKVRFENRNNPVIEDSQF
jgi:hypothetical protein